MVLLSPTDPSPTARPQPILRKQKLQDETSHIPTHSHILAFHIHLEFYTLLFPFEKVASFDEKGQLIFKTSEENQEKAPLAIVNTDEKLEAIA